MLESKFDKVYKNAQRHLNKDRKKNYESLPPPLTRGETLQKAYFHLTHALPYIEFYLANEPQYLDREVVQQVVDAAILLKILFLFGEQGEIKNGEF
jgi:hypothetical protein